MLYPRVRSRIPSPLPVLAALTPAWAIEFDLEGGFFPLSLPLLALI